MPKLKIFRGPEAFAGGLQKQVNDWAQRQNVRILGVSSTTQKSPLPFSPNYLTLTVTYEPRHKPTITPETAKAIQGMTGSGHCAVCNELYPKTFKQCKCGAILPWAQVETLATKKCSFCAEEIKSDAKKCRFCGEWLDKADSSIE